mmetsp:Transcript_41674/g.129689  ORF Transcript_41674/g.129689 Transcript_41674/m.129689 type:complete len:223 (-) Transcript_41674:1430-2098(-)
MVDLLLELADALRLLAGDGEVALHEADGLLLPLDLVEPQFVLDLALFQRALLHLDLLVKHRQLLVPPDQLRVQDVPFAGHGLKLLALVLPLHLCLLDRRLQLLDLLLLQLDDLLGLPLLLLVLQEVVLRLLRLLLNELVVEVLRDHRLVLLLDLLFELLDLVVHHLELLPHLRDLLLRLDQVLRVEVLVGPHGLVQILLLAELGLLVGDALLQVGHVVVALL